MNRHILNAFRHLEQHHRKSGSLLSIGWNSQNPTLLSNIVSKARTRLFSADICDVRDENATVKQLISKHATQLEAEDIPDATFEAEYMVAHILGVKKHNLEDFQETMLSPEMNNKLDQLMTCRLSRMPLQYILGDWDFYNITLKLRPPVFIPRPETEQLVSASLDLIRKLKSPKILDICSGSGAIGLAILYDNKSAHCTAVDQSSYAVELAQENARDLGLSDRYTVLQGKVSDDSFPIDQPEQFDLIVTNPPYVLRKDVMGLQPEIKLYEDLRALDGGKDGLDVIKPILRNAAKLLKPQGHVILEMDPCHSYLIPSWMKGQTDLDLEITQTLKDFNKHDRFIIFNKS